MLRQIYCSLQLPAQRRHGSIQTAAVHRLGELPLGCCRLAYDAGDPVETGWGYRCWQSVLTLLQACDGLQGKGVVCRLCQHCLTHVCASVAT
jgi:hypothetical protein